MEKFKIEKFVPLFDLNPLHVFLKGAYNFQLIFKRL